MLHRTGKRICQLRKGIPWPRNSFEAIHHRFRLQVKIEKKAFLALLYMQHRSSVNKPEPSRRINDLNDPTEIHRPQAQRLDLDRNNLT